MPLRPLLLAAACALAAAAPALGTPITGITGAQHGDRLDVGYRVRQPGAATSCRVNVVSYLVALVPPRPVRGYGRFTVNGCPGAGPITQSWNLAGLQAGRYAVCVRAVSDLGGRRRSRHIACRPVELGSARGA